MQMKKEYNYKEEASKLCRILQEKRKEKGLTQEDISKKTGLTRQMVSKIETYSSSPKLDTIMRYCNGLGYDLNDIILNNFMSK